MPLMACQVPNIRSMATTWPMDTFSRQFLSRLNLLELFGATISPSSATAVDLGSMRVLNLFLPHASVTLTGIELAVTMDSLGNPIPRDSPCAFLLKNFPQKCNVSFMTVATQPDISYVCVVKPTLRHYFQHQAPNMTRFLCVNPQTQLMRRGDEFPLVWRAE